MNHVRRITSARLERPDRTASNGPAGVLGSVIRSVLVLTALGALPAAAGVGGASGPTWPATLQVGAPLSAYIDIFNASGGVNASEQVDILAITFTPSCAKAQLGVCQEFDPDVFTLASPAIGDPASSCGGKTFGMIKDAQGVYTLTLPVGGVHLGPADGSGNSAIPPNPRFCRIAVNGVVAKMPKDATPNDAPITTIQFAKVVLRGHTSLSTGSANGQSSVTLTPAQMVDLSISKSDGVTDVTTGAALVYTLVVSNAGPTAADGATLRDPQVSGLLKTGTPTCGSPVGGAVCPTATLTNANLESVNGVVIPTLPAGGSLTFSVFATVQAPP